MDYVQSNVQSKSGFDIWLRKIKLANWSNINDVKASFATADLLRGTNRIIFDVGGNKYRIICSFFIGRKNFHLYINWIGTHAEYTKLCASNKQYTTDKY